MASGLRLERGKIDLRFDGHFALDSRQSVKICGDLWKTIWVTCQPNLLNPNAICANIKKSRLVKINLTNAHSVYIFQLRVNPGGNRDALSGLISVM